MPFVCIHTNFHHFKIFKKNSALHLYKSLHHLIFSFWGRNCFIDNVVVGRQWCVNLSTLVIWRMYHPKPQHQQCLLYHLVIAFESKYSAINLFKGKVILKLSHLIAKNNFLKIHCPKNVVVVRPLAVCWSTVQWCGEQHVEHL